MSVEVYLLENIVGDPRYHGFACSGFPQTFPPNRTTRDWKVTRLAKGWKPRRARGHVRPFNDCPSVNMRPAFSPRAVEILRGFLEPNGELLPLKTSSGPFFAFNLTTVADVLNYRRSQIRWLEKPITALNIERYEFFASRLKGLSIFRLPEDAIRVYVTTPFVERVMEHNLRGIEFPKVWPLPRGVSWKYLRSIQRRERESRGLPPGQTIAGESVFITFALKNPKAFATDAQEERILHMLAELRALLVDENSDAPSVGDPQFGDSTEPGKCKIVLSCPSANALVEAIRPWLSKLKWPHAVTVVKRFGPYLEPKVRQARVKI